MGRKFVFASEQDFNFWRAHGVNYILSDYENATWMPMFDIYNGGTAPDLNAITKSIMDKYGMDSENWPDDGRAALGWAINAQQTLAIYYMEAKKRIQEESPEEDLEKCLHAPHNPIVWGVFNYLKNEIASKTA